MKSEFWNVDYPSSRYCTTRFQKWNELRFFDTLTLLSAPFLISFPLLFIGLSEIPVDSHNKNLRMFCIAVCEAWNKFVNSIYGLILI